MSDEKLLEDIGQYKYGFHDPKKTMSSKLKEA
jgi:hypothetical protein